MISLYRDADGRWHFPVVSEDVETINGVRLQRFTTRSLICIKFWGTKWIYKFTVPSKWVGDHKSFLTRG